MQEMLLAMHGDATEKLVHAATEFGHQRGRRAAIEEILATLNGKEAKPDGEENA